MGCPLIPAGSERTSGPFLRRCNLFLKTSIALSLIERLMVIKTITHNRSERAYRLHQLMLTCGSYKRIIPGNVTSPIKEETIRRATLPFPFIVALNGSMVSS